MGYLQDKLSIVVNGMQWKLYQKGLACQSSILKEVPMYFLMWFSVDKYGFAKSLCTDETYALDHCYE